MLPVTRAALALRPRVLRRVSVAHRRASAGGCCPAAVASSDCTGTLRRFRHSKRHETSSQCGGSHHQMIGMRSAGASSRPFSSLPSAEEHGDAGSGSAVDTAGVGGTTGGESGAAQLGPARATLNPYMAKLRSALALREAMAQPSASGEAVEPEDAAAPTVADAAQDLLGLYMGMRTEGLAVPLDAARDVMGLFFDAGLPDSALGVLTDTLLRGDAVDIRTCNFVVTRCIRLGRVGDAVALFRRMLAEGGDGAQLPIPSGSTVAYLVRGLLERGKVQQALALFDEAVQGGVQPTTQAVNAVLGGCAGALGQATEAHSREELLGHAKALFVALEDLGVDANGASYARVVEACCAGGDFSAAGAFLRDACTALGKVGIVRNPAIWTVPMVSMCKAGRPVDADALFTAIRGVVGDKAAARNPAPVAELVRALADDGRHERGWEVYTEYMAMPKAVASLQLFHAALHAVAHPHQDQDHRLRVVLHDIGAQQHLYADPLAYHLVMRALLARSPPAVERAWGVVDAMRLAGHVPSETTYNTLVGALVEAGDIDAAHKAVSAAVEAGVTPDVVMLNLLVKGAVSSGNIARALSIIDDFAAVGVGADAITFTNLMRSWADAGQLDKACELFATMCAAHTRDSDKPQRRRGGRRRARKHGASKELDAQAGTVLVQACVKASRPQFGLALEVVRMMQETGISPDPYVAC